MKKFLKIFIMFFSVLLLSSCTGENLDLSGKIKAPDNIKPPLNGTWKIESFINAVNPNLTEKAAGTYLGKEVLIDNELVAISSNYTLSPSFKVKNVNTKDYLWEYKISPEVLGIEDETIKIVTVISADQFYYEFLIIEDGKVLLFLDNGFFNLKKESDIVDEYKIKERMVKGKVMTELDESAPTKTGVLIGLKSPIENSLNEEYNYRTLYLRFDNRKVTSSYVKDGLIAIKKNGFWTVKVDNLEIREDDNKIQNNSLSKIENQKMAGQKEIIIKNKSDLTKNITYLGNDFISLENVEFDREAEKEIRTLSLYALDNVNKGLSLNIVDVLGENGSKFFYESMFKDDEIRLKRELIENQNTEIDENNFGIGRKNGHWDLVGRVNYSEEGENRLNDFYLKTIIPEKFVSYDNLSNPMQAIKANFPNTVDAFESPNKDVIIVMSNNSLNFYGMDKKEMGDIPIAKVNLLKKEEVVMLEWTNDKHPQNWDEEFLKDDYEKLEFNP